jgi:hypothetical protein
MELAFMFQSRNGFLGIRQPSIKMNKFQRWILSKIFTKLLKQGFSHPKNMVEIQTLILDVADKEFNEDGRENLRYWMVDSVKKA